MKLFRPFFKLSSILTGLMIFIASVANATTYYSKVGATALPGWQAGQPVPPKLVELHPLILQQLEIFL